MRKIMARHWNNPSPFALDLSGASHRQGVFVEKMFQVSGRGRRKKRKRSEPLTRATRTSFQIDWLHSPAARETALRLISKYNRFMELVCGNDSGHMCVPTLDVDLAWHTHQLSPRAYYQHTVTRCGRLVDHDDKVPEDKLSDDFAWTAAKYEAQFGEPYSECTCWYCEAVRPHPPQPLVKPSTRKLIKGKTPCRSISLT